MSDIQEKLNQILSNPEALRQVQSLGEQLGLNTSEQPPPQPQRAKPEPPPTIYPPTMNNDMLKAMTRLAPLLNSSKGEDDITRLLHSLKPFLSYERQQKIDKAEKMIRLIRLMPLLRENGLF
ncbi:MAG: hypothetical protein MJ089_07125 [Ruminococcus sp.]|nr:hypothetical protein [Ruminococcus sp.]